MLRVALTGGIGTGKSTASKILNELGAFIFDADKEGKNILKNKLFSKVSHSLCSKKRKRSPDHTKQTELILPPSPGLGNL